VDSESLLKSFKGVNKGGVLVIIFILFFAPFADQKNHEKVSGNLTTILKSPRPLKNDTLGEKTPLVTAGLSSKKNETLFHSLIQDAANKYKVEPALIKAIIMAESGYNPTAISKKGAVGLMQLMPATASSLGVEDLFNPAHNINGGVKYFKKLLIRFNGDLTLALAAYNAGTTNVKKYQGVPPYRATLLYIEKVLKYYQYYQGSSTI
jgi:soluble lytic murein transglycosylase-like protein